jgi:hypothetical protein
MQEISLSTLDLAVITVYLAVVFYIGLRMARQTHDAEDLFLAGRRLTWLPIGLSLFASNISSTTLIGLAGAAYTWGIAVANYEWMAPPLPGQIDRFTYRRSITRATVTGAWWQDYRAYAAVLMVLTVWLVAAFW